MSEGERPASAAVAPSWRTGYLLRPPVWRRNGGCRMCIAEDLRKCVVYLGHRADAGSDDRLATAGTGFVVSLDETGGSYLVTAGHVARELGESFVIRINDHRGAGNNLQIDDPDWTYHQDKTVDLAVMGFESPQWAECVPILKRQFITEQYMESRDIGAGDLVHIVGCFQLLEGRHRNLPLVHTGHVALLPEDEPIPVDGIGDVRGYLVQVPTLKGSSGSPVFVRRHVSGVTNETSPGVPGWMYGDSWFFGVNMGAWYKKPDEVFNLPRAGVTVPVSMAIVIPSERLAELLEMPKLKEERQYRANKEALEKAATLTGAAMGESEQARRRDEGLRRALSMPPTRMNRIKGTSNERRNRE
jgi:hypothetical protein